jgi:hemolysin type calcium-binding protein
MRATTYCAARAAETTSTRAVAPISSSRAVGPTRCTAGTAKTAFWPAAAATASGRRRDDYVRGGGGADHLNSGTGNDTVIVSRPDGKIESVDCGSGVDRAAIHSEDNEVNCEDVKVVS